MLHDTLIEILSSQMRVSVGRHHLEDAIVDRQQRDIEGATTEVVHQNILLSLLVKTVSNGCSRRFIDDTQNVEPRNNTSVFGGLPLLIVEVSWDSDHCMLHLLPQIVLR